MKITLMFTFLLLWGTHCYSTTQPTSEDYASFEFLNELNIYLRDKKAPDSEIKKWMNNLIQGGSKEGVYRFLVFDTEYFQLEKKTKSVISKKCYTLLTFLGYKND